MATITAKVYGKTEQLESVGTLDIYGTTYAVCPTGLKHIAYLLVGPRGGALEVLRQHGRPEFLVITDKRGKMPYGRLLLTDTAGTLRIADKVLA